MLSKNQLWTPDPVQTKSLSPQRPPKSSTGTLTKHRVRKNK
jgi:hypothetical protein